MEALQSAVEQSLILGKTVRGWLMVATSTRVSARVVGEGGQIRREDLRAVVAPATCVGEGRGLKRDARVVARIRSCGKCVVRFELSRAGPVGTKRSIESSAGMATGTTLLLILVDVLVRAMIVHRVNRIPINAHSSKSGWKVVEV